MGLREGTPEAGIPIGTVLCLIAAVFTLDGLASAQAAGSKRKLSQQSLLNGHPSMVSACQATPNAPQPATTTETWTGAGGDNNWGTASNWSPNGVPNGSTVLVTIGTTTANVNLNINATVDTLTLSNSGDTLRGKQSVFRILSSWEGLRPRLLCLLRDQLHDRRLPETSATRLREEMASDTCSPVRRLGYGRA